jgi:Rrf2 family protein
MQHLLQVSRKVDYALRAMIYLAAQPGSPREPLQDIARKNEIPREFLAKILKVLGNAGLVTALRGPGGGVSIARPPSQISFLDVIEAVEGPVVLNLCLDDTRSCSQSSVCTMQSVWKAGQERMLDVYRTTMLSDLVGQTLPTPPIQLGMPRDVVARALVE